MTEIALYRKYRPQNLKEVLGQEHIVSVLRNAIENNTFSHAYLFSGTRGTGKTSIARILAREIGCTPNDIYEIDAASNRKIDDVREIREAVHSLPFDSPYKTYIIDEVHMLTKEAFNALLKTLEEPPAHVVFVLATTEAHKLPQTISSRCQSFSFNRPSHETLKKVVLDISKKEGVSLEAPSTDLIALLGDGSFRDVLGVLQKIVEARNIHGAKITHTDVSKIVGAPDTHHINEILNSIQEGDASKGISHINEALEAGVDMKVFYKLLLKSARAVMLLRHAPKMEEMLKESFSEEDFKFLKDLGAKKDAKINSNVLKELLDTYSKLGGAYIEQLPLELALIRIIGE